MAELTTTKMSSKGQVVIPEEIRKRLGCETHAPKGVAIVLPACSNRRAMKAVMHPALSPSGA